MNDALADTENIGRLTLEIRHDEAFKSPRDWDNAGEMICWHERYDLGDKHDYRNPREFVSDMLRNVVDLDTTVVRALVAMCLTDADKDNRYDNRYDYNLYKTKASEWTYGGDWKKEFYGSDKESHNLREWLATIVDTNGTKDDWLVTEIIGKMEKTGMVVLPLCLYDHSGITMSTVEFSCPWDSGQVGFIYVLTSDPEFAHIDALEEKIKAAKARIEAEVREYDLHLRGEWYGYVVKDEDGAVLDSCGGYLGMDHVLEEGRSMAEGIAADPGMCIGAGI